MKSFTPEAPTAAPCPLCAKFYAQLHRDNGVVACAVYFFCTAVSRCVSPFQAITDYMEAVHASGHVDNAPPLDAEARMAALHDEGPERRQVTAEMIRVVERMGSVPHRFPWFRWKGTL